VRHNCVEYGIYAHTIHDDEDDYYRIVVRNLRGGILTTLELDMFLKNHRDHSCTYINMGSYIEYLDTLQDPPPPKGGYQARNIF